MNCALCIGLLREKNPCGGCNGGNERKPYHCVVCGIKNCGKLAGSDSRYCFECDEYPCKRMKQLDKRYRTNYRMSMIDNLNRIRDEGIRSFIGSERIRWSCPGCGGIISVHRAEYGRINGLIDLIAFFFACKYFYGNTPE